MRARVRFLSICLCLGGVVSADDVPAPPSESGLAPQAIFDSQATDVPPAVNSAAPITPDSVYKPAPLAQASQQRYYYMPNSGAPPRDFQFAGYNGGFTMAIGGTVDELFNAGIQIVAETGWQMGLGDGAFRDVAFTIGVSNQTLWGKDQRSIVLPDGSIRGLETLSISTVKSGAYIGRSLGGIDVFVGAYGKLGAAVLNEDREFFDPLVEYTPIQDIEQTAFAGGGGLEVGMALLEREKSSLAIVAGVEALYLGTFDNPSSDWTLFTTTGLQWEYDITDGLFPERDWSPRARGGRRGRRCRR